MHLHLLQLFRFCSASEFSSFQQGAFHLPLMGASGGLWFLEINTPSGTLNKLKCLTRIIPHPVFSSSMDGPWGIKSPIDFQWNGVRNVVFVNT